MLAVKQAAPHQGLAKISAAQASAASVVIKNKYFSENRIGRTFHWPRFSFTLADRANSRDVRSGLEFTVNDSWRLRLPICSLHVTRVLRKPADSSLRFAGDEPALGRPEEISHLAAALG